jgi:peptidoglycan/xylan/chitin deacetylase (PgdA/CDA1 family)
MTRHFACLTYHGIGDQEGQYTVREASFRSQLDHLHAGDYMVEGFEGLQQRLASGDELPGRYVALTFDDGEVSTMRVADLLEEHSFKATVFVTRDRSLHNPAYIRESQIQELRRRGFSIGTHGTTHRKLTRISEQECRNELAESRRWLEDILGENVCFTAVPGGFLNSRVLRLAAEEKYSMIGSCREQMNAALYRPFPVRVVSRVSIRRHFSMATFISVVQGDPSFYLRRQLRAAALWLPKRLLPA